MTQRACRTAAKLPPFPRLGGRLYIFPAFIPMVELVPWLLTAVGALAGATQLAFWQRHRRVVRLITAACFALAAAVYFWGAAHRPTEAEGSRLVTAADLPKLVAGTPPHTAAASVESEALKALWSVDLPDEPLSEPVFSDGLMLIGTFGGVLEARDETDGHVVWSFKKHEPIFTNVSVAAGQGFIGEGLHTAPAAALTAFALPSGQLLWERQFRSHVEAPATLDAPHRRLWTCAGSEGLWSLDMRDGAVLWHAALGHIDATPLYNEGDDALYISAQPDEHKVGAVLMALDPDTGAKRWQLPLPGNTMGSPQRGPGGNIFVTTAIGQVGPKVASDAGWSHALSATGKLLWTVPLPGLALPEPLLLPVQGLVIHTLKTGEIVALRMADGSIAWRVKLGDEFDAPASLRPGKTPLLAALTASGTLALLHAEDGTEIRRMNATQGGYVPPVFRNDMLYVTTPRRMTAYGGLHLLTRDAP